MKVAIITPHLPPVVGGISTFTREILVALADRRVDCWGFSRQGANGSRWEVMEGGAGQFIWRVFLAVWRMQPDAVHAHAHWYTLLPGAIYRALRPSTRLVFTFHTQPVERSGLLFAAVRMLLLLCTAITYVSRELQIRIRPLHDCKQLVTYPAPEPQILERNEGLAAHCTADPRDRTIVFVGPLVWPLKVEGVRRLVEAFSRIADRHPQTVLVIVGDGPLRPSLEVYARHLLGSRVVFTGNVENVAPRITACDVYAHISLQEGVPISLLNALALGKTVLATSVGGIPEVVRDCETGLLVEPEVGAIAMALNRLLSDTDLRTRLGNAAANCVRATFTWERTVDQLVGCYRGRA